MNKPTTTGIIAKMIPQERFKLLGEVVTLLMQSKLHCSSYVLDIYNHILPPIDHNQFRIYRKGVYPVGFVSWAFLTKEKAESYLKGEYSVKIDDWNCGDNMIYTDFIAPFGDMRAIAKDLTHNIFPDTISRSVKVSKKGKIDSVKTFYGKNVKFNKTTHNL